MTVPTTIAAAAFLGKHLKAGDGDVDLSRSMIATLAEALMSAQASAQCNAGYGEQSEDRENCPNDYRHRAWDTSETVTQRRFASLPEFPYLSCSVPPGRGVAHWSLPNAKAPETFGTTSTRGTESPMPRNRTSGTASWIIAAPPASGPAPGAASHGHRDPGKQAGHRERDSTIGSVCLTRRSRPERLPRPDRAPLRPLTPLPAGACRIGALLELEGAKDRGRHACHDRRFAYLNGIDHCGGVIDPSVISLISFSPSALTGPERG